MQSRDKGADFQILSETDFNLDFKIRYTFRYEYRMPFSASPAAGCAGSSPLASEMRAELSRPPRKGAGLSLPVCLLSDGAEALNMDHKKITYRRCSTRG